MVLPSLLFFFITAMDLSSINAVTPVWSSGTNIPKPVRAGNSASYSKNNEGWLVIVSGRDQNDAILKTTQRYNASTNIWDTLAPHPTGLLGGATAIIKDTLYVVVGVVNPPGSGQNIVYKLNLVQNVWSQAANFPAQIGDAKAVSYQDSLLYTAGGFGNWNEGVVYVYNAVANTWRQATSMPCTGRKNFGGFAVTGDTLVYMCGTAAFGSSVYDDSVYVGVISQTDRSVINWTRGANFPGQTRTFFDACNWGGKGIIMTGGSTDNTFNTPSNECYTFSPGRNQWTQLPNKPTSWLTGQSGSVSLENNVWKLVCASGYNAAYLSVNEILSDTIATVGINEEAENIYGYTLHQNYPNPFNPGTSFEFTIDDKAGRNALITLNVYNITGEKVTSLFNGTKNPGNHRINFDGSSLPSGVYLYTLLVNDRVVDTKSMVLMK